MTRIQTIENRVKAHNEAPNDSPKLPPVQFRRAVREQVKLKIILGGISGTGKTWTGLELAQGLGEQIVLLDTEGGSGELYADSFQYDYARIDPPYTPEIFVHYIDSAIATGYDVIVLDSISHEWEGILEIADSAANSTKSPYGGWGIATPRHRLFVEAILHKPIHIIATCRMKTGYEMVKNWKGQDTPQKKPAPVFVQREGIDYEFTLGFQLIGDGMAIPLKDRTSMFKGKPNIQLTKEIGTQLKQWANSGKDHSEEFQKLSHQLERTSNLAELKQTFSAGYAKIQSWSNNLKYIQKYTQQKDKLKAKFKNGND